MIQTTLFSQVSAFGHVCKSIRLTALLTLLFLLGVGQAWATPGDEITSVSNIVSGKTYFIKGVRSSTTYYLAFTDAIGSQAGTESTTKGGAVPITFTAVSGGWNLTTPKGNYIAPGTSNGTINVSSSAILVSATNQSSKIRLSITSGNDTWSIQKNTGRANFGGYKNTQTDITLIEAAEYTVGWSVNGGACSGSPSTTAFESHGVVVLPTAPTSSNCDNSKAFVGWSASQIDGTTNTRPSDLFATAAEAPYVTANVTYYAVFASTGSTTKTMQCVISYSDLSTAGYAANDGSHTSTATATDASGVTCPVAWTSSNVMQNSSNLQFQKNNGYIYNSTDLGTINSVSYTAAQGTLTTWYGTSSHPTSGSQGSGKGYFTVKETGNSNAGLTASITINFTKSVTTYSNYATSCCTSLGAINGSVEYTDPSTVVLTWDAMSNVHASTPYAVSYRTGSAAFGTSNVGSISTNGAGKKTCTITGLSCNTDYDFKIAVTAASGYCDRDTVLEDKNSGKWSVTYTYTGSKASKTSGPNAGANVCGDYEATFAPVTGYHLPDDITLTIGGVSKTIETDYSWSVEGETGVGTLEIDDSKINGAIAVTITAEVDPCTAFSLHTGNKSNEGWNLNQCFSDVDWGASDDAIWEGEFPSTNECYVGWQGSNSTYGAYWAVGGIKTYDIPTGRTLGWNGSDYYSDYPATALGAFHIYKNSTDGNYYLRFKPEAYVLRTGTDTPTPSWTSRAMTKSASNANYYETDVLALTSSLIDQNVYVALKASNNNGYVWCNFSSSVAAEGNVKVKVSSGDANSDFRATDLADGDAGTYGKFRIDVTKDVNNWKLAFVPYWHITYNHTSSSGTGSGSMDISTPVSCEGDAAARTVVAAANGFTAPSNMRFKEWRTNADGTGTKYDPSDDVVLSGDITLYAIWEDIPPYEITYHVPSCASVSPTSAQENITQGDAIGTLPTPTNISINGLSYTFDGWSESEITSETTSAPTKITSSFVPTDNTDLYAVYRRTGTGAAFNPSDAVDADFYITEASGTYYMTHSVYSTSYFYSSTSKTNALFHITKNNSNKFVISFDNSGTQTYVRVYTSNSNHYVGTTTTAGDATQFTITQTSTAGASGTWEVHYTDGRGLMYRELASGENIHRFANFAFSNAATSGYGLIEFEPAPATVYITDVDCRVERTISVTTPSNGEVTYSGTRKVGETITLTVTPDEGYAATALTATYNDGSSKNLSVSPALEDVGGDYTFTMPDYNVTVSATFTARPATPTFSHSTGKYANTQSVTLDCETDGATIYYTTDGTTPTSSSTEYSSAISVSSSPTTIKAIAYKAGVKSMVSTSTLTLLSGTEYVAKSLSEIWDNDEVIYVGTTSSGSYAMTNNQGTNHPLVYSVADSLTASSSLVTNCTANIQWNITQECDSLIFYPNGTTSTYLYNTNANDGVKVGTGDNKKFVIKNSYLQNVKTSRYIGIYNNADWRSYESINSNSNIYNQTFTYYVKSPSTACIATPCPATLTGFETTYASGDPSDAQSFSVKARNISTGDVTVSAPTGYEVCLTEDGTYTSSVTITPVSSSVSPTTVYVRLKSGLDAGNVNGNITISAAEAGATSRTLPLTGTVNKAAAGLEFTAATYNLSLTGSSISSATDIYSTNSGGELTVTITKGGEASSDASLDTDDKQISATATGTYTVTLSQATTSNYLAAEVSCTVVVSCGTPATITGLSAGSITSRSATLSWDAVDGADHYVLYVTDGTNVVVNNVDVDDTSYDLSDLNPNVTYSWSVNVENSCGESLATAVDGSDFTTLLSVIYHSDSEDDHVVDDITSGDDLTTKHVPASACASDRIFIGWSTSEVSAQQSQPAIETTDGTLDDISDNVDLYAVFASRNGGYELNTQSNIFNETWGSTNWDGTNKIVSGAASSWAVDANISSNPFDLITISPSSYTAVVVDVKAMDHYLISEQKFLDLHSVEVKASSRNSATVKVEVWISTDKSSWTQVGDTKSIKSDGSLVTQTYTLATPGDYYVKILVKKKSDTSGSTIKLAITSIRPIKANRTYYLSDFSTSCSGAASATVTWSKNGGTSVDPSAPAVGDRLTMPDATKDNYRFGGWKATINESLKSETYLKDAEFLVNHDVTFTAQWTRYIEDISGVSRMTSYKDISVRSFEIDSVVVNNTSASTLTAELTGTDASLFTVTIDAANKRVGTTETHIPYYVTYTPTSYNAIHSADITFTCDGVSSSPITVRGRSLPEEFVLASKLGDQWYALPNTIRGNNTAITPIKITVNDPTTPTAATYAPSTTIYKGAGRYSDVANVYGIRFTDDGTYWLQVSTTSSTNHVRLAGAGTPNMSICQDWLLSTNDFNAYTLTVPTSTAGDKKLGLYTYSGIKMGYHSSPSTADIYLLPVTNKLTLMDATVKEWGEHGVIVEADMTNVASATMHVDGGTPADANLSGVNIADGAALTSVKNVRVYAESVTVGAVANETKQLYIHWLNSLGNEIAASQIEIPYVVATDGDMATLSPSKTTWPDREVHVLPGVTLTANTGSYSPKDATIKELHVYPGATLKVTTGTLNVTTLRLRYGWTRAGAKQYNSARVYIADNAALTKTTASMDYDIYERSDGQHYYPFAVPFETSVSSIDFADSYLASRSTYGTHYGIDYYDGAARAESGAGSANWQQVASDATLQPGVGYTIVALPVKGEAIIRVPLTYNDAWTADGEKAMASYDADGNGEDEDHTKNVVAVTAHTGTAIAVNNRHKGWNLLGVPFMSCYKAATSMHEKDEDGFVTGKMTLTGDASDPFGWDADGNIYVSVPTHDFSEYVQYDITEDNKHLLPGWCFFMQMAKSGNLTFAVTAQKDTSSLPLYVPQRTTEADAVVRTGIILSGADDASDKTTLLVSDRYSADYEIGADLEKMFGEGYTLATYSLTRGTRLAYNAMSRTDAQQIIPIGYRAPAEGTYTFTLNPRYAEADIERVELIDYLTGDVTDLMAVAEGYTFTSDRTQDDSRFALNVVPAPKITTDIDDSGGAITVPGAEKLIIDDKLYIIYGNRLYDVTGKRVTRITK